MPVRLAAPDPASLHPVPGVRIGVAMAGIRKLHRRDLVLFVLDEHSAVAAVFTRNRFEAAPVQVCRQHLAGGHRIRALVVTRSTPDTSPVAVLMTVSVQQGGLFDQQFSLSYFEGVKPNGPGSPFPYGFAVEPPEA